MNDEFSLDSLNLEQQGIAQELELEYNSTFIALKKNLLDISGIDDLIKSVLMLEYINNEKFEDDYEGEATEIIDNNNIDSQLHWKNENFRCLCGKSHLKNLNIFSLENKEKNIIIGSTCIDKIHILSKLHQNNEALINKITEILQLMDIDTTKKENKPCLKCGEYLIKKKTDYKNPHRKNLCKICIIKNNYICCKDCPKKIKIEYLRGTIKIRCKSCWWKNRKLTQLH